ncbi:hypothetical protein [Candidatus Southlakia epibionticum]|uniref:hypothetical protein n=1 Tax=Candidatus Southlakia epibionticum TaxID=3043284 RepID=UPI0035E3F0B9
MTACAEAPSPLLISRVYFEREASERSDCMAFGPIMKLTTESGLKLELAPFTR